MQYTHPGRSGLSVSRLCLGTMNFGPMSSEPDSYIIMDAALEAGINFFDTANRYGTREGRGHVGLTEEIIGRWWAQGGGRREKVVLATKLFGAMGDWPNEGKLSALNIRRACEASLQRLQTDYIDIYQMHHVDRETPWEEIWQGMEQLQREGKILYVGSSNFAGWHIAKACEAARQRNFYGLITEQCKYSLNSNAQPRWSCCRPAWTMAWASSPGVRWAAVCWAACCARLRKDGARTRPCRRISKLLRPQLVRYEAFCNELGEAPADVALAWLLAQPAVTAPIIGPRSLMQLQGNLRGLEITLDAEQLAALDEIWPGPGGPAPEAWAW